MKIKVFECGIKADLDDDFAKVISYFKSHNLDITFDREKTKVRLPEWNVRVNLVLPLDGKYDIVMYCYDRIQQDPNGQGKAENFSKKTSSVFIPTGTLEDPIGFHWKAIAHEIMHCLFHKVWNTGITLSDPMDLFLKNGVRYEYYKNDDPYALDGNFVRAFAMLEPYWSLLQPDLKPVVTLRRGYADQNQQLGDLSIGSFKAKTLERPWKNNQKNVSCIPKGTYDVVWSYSWKFLKYTYEVLNVPNRTNIRIHSGNYFFDIEGCILLGDKYGDLNKDTSADILNSRDIVKKFEDHMGRKSFTLQII